MLIHEELKADHDSIKELMNSISGQSPENRGESLFKLKSRWIAHSRSEETVFYRTLLDEGTAGGALLLAMRDHRKIEEAFNELERVAIESKHWVSAFEGLKKLLEHHMSEEEEIIFPKARRFVSRYEAEEMAEVFRDLRREVFEDLGLEASGAM